MHIVFNKRDPVYSQVVEYFKQEIANGSLQKNDEIPSRRELAQSLKINPNTAQRAYKEMEERGLIYTERNQPSRITNNQDVLEDVRTELVTEATEEFIRTMQKIHVPLDECVDWVKEKYKTLDGEKELND